MKRKNRLFRVREGGGISTGLLRLILPVLLLTLAACSTNRDRLTSDLTYKDLRTVLKEEKQGLDDLRDGERESLESRKALPAFEVKPELPEYNPLEESRISISVRDEPLHDVLFVVARNAGVNIVIDPDISLENSITISFEDAPASVVVETLLDAYDLAWTLKNNVLYVRSYEERSFDLDFMNSKSEVTIDSGGDVFGSASADGGSNELSGNFQVAASMGKGVESDSLYDFLQKNIESLIKGEGTSTSGTCTLDPVSGHLYVRTTPRKMRAVAKFVETLRRKLSLQVVIDAQILEVTLSDSFDLGVDWNFVQTRVSGGKSYSYGLGFDSDNGLGTRGSSGDSEPTAIVLGQATSAVDSLTSVFETTINALETFGGVKVVSNPHVRARHGTPALVTSGTTKSYIKEITRETDDDTGDVSVSTDTSTAFEGVMLGVMPFINDDRSVDLNIFPITSQVNLENNVEFDDGSTVTLPEVDVRNVSTSVRTHSGDTIILGGLIYKTSSKTDNTVPGASDVPGLGWLFNSQNDDETLKELVIIMHIKVTG